MAVVAEYPLNTFAGVNTLQALGSIVAGNSAPAGIGNALSIADGVMKSTITQSDPATATGIRAEITAPADAYAERWYTWEFMLAADFNPLLDPILLMQMHDTPDGGDGAKAIPFSLYYTQGGDLAIYVPAQTLPTEGNTSKIIPIDKAEKNRWYKACLHALWSTTATGLREFFLDGVPMLREFNLPTMYSDVTGPYFKCGVYDATHNARFGQVTAYYRNVKIYSGNDGYQTVLGGLPQMPRQRSEP
jgi:hypothetical protein